MTFIIKIVSHETLPYPEFKTNPYAVLLTTTMGGHLSWFEVGGTRWHAKPTVNFLNYIAFKTDLSALEPPKADGAVKDDSGAPKKQLLFDPMRRRMHTQGSDYGNQ